MRLLTILIGAGLCAATALPLLAQVDQGQEDATKFGYIDQNTPGIVNGGQACGPTSCYNSFVYLNNQFPSAGIGGLLGAGSVSAINELSGDVPGGIPVSGGTAMQAGKNKYINDHGLSGKISVEGLGNNGILTPNDAARFIADQLQKGQDVEMGFYWANSNGTTRGGGHVVTVTGIDYDETGQNGAMNIIDPWDGVGISGNLTVGNNSLVLGYTGGGAGPGGVDGQDPDNPTDAGFGAVSWVTAESVVPLPEPAVVLGVLPLFLLKRRTA